VVGERSPPSTLFNSTQQPLGICVSIELGDASSFATAKVDGKRWYVARAQARLGEAARC
jgi:hypothetical protein